MIKRIYLIISMLLALATTAGAHITVKLGRYDALSQTAIINYREDGDGVYRAQRDFPVNSVEGIAYAYDPKTHCLYVKTMSGNYIVQLDKKSGEKYKKQDLLKKYSGEELTREVNAVTQSLETTYASLNEKRAAEVKAKKDREEAARRQAEQEARDKAEAEARRKASLKAHEVPTGGLDFECEICDHVEKGANSLNVKSIIGDKIYALEKVNGALGTYFEVIHVYPLRSDLTNYGPYKEHMKFFSSELKESAGLTTSEIRDFNKAAGRAQVQRLTSLAPYGFLSDVSLNCGNGLTASFRFTNLSSKTVKSLVFRIGYTTTSGSYATAEFEGAGPIEQYYDVAWDFTSSRYPCISSLSDVSLTLTYTDGTKRELTGSEVIIDAGE